MNKKIFFLGLIILFEIQSAFALCDSMGLKKVNGVDYIVHKVEKSEGLFAVSRRYGVSVEAIKMANNNIESLVLGQEILIPIPKVSVEQKTFFHHVEKGETLYAISKLYHVQVEDLKKWNSLGDNAIKEGDELKIIQVVKTTEVVPNQAVKEKKVGTSTSSSTAKPGEIVEEGVATYIEDPSINSRKAIALHKKAPVGTIILVTNLMNGKQVYVKVVGSLVEDGIQSNEIIKLSTYTAKQLKIRDQLTRVRLNYFIE